MLDDVTRLYDRALVLLALATTRASGHCRDDPEADATALRDRIRVAALPSGGFRETGPHPYQANAQMPLLEAAMAWEDQTPDSLWRDKRLPYGTFVYEAAPTTYFDHTMAAFDKLAALSRTPGFDALAGLDLG